MPLILKTIEDKRSAMTIIAKERLYLTSDKRRVVSTGPDAAFLLAAQGLPIPDEYAPLVQAYLAEKAKPKPPPEPDPVKEKEPPPTTTGPPEDAPFEDRETRIPKSLRKRGRTRKDE